MLQEVIDQLLNSGMLDNEELGVTLLAAPNISPEERKRRVDKFIDDFEKDPTRFIKPENHSLLTAWLELYREQEEKDIKERVRKI